MAGIRPRCEVVLVLNRKEAVTLAPAFADAVLLLADLKIIRSGAVQPAIEDLERFLARQPQPLAIAAGAPEPLPGEDVAEKALAGLRERLARASRLRGERGTGCG